MPIYEYVCTNTNCGHELEALQKMSDERLVFCPSCGESTLKRKISAAGFRLKGTGWYETDFKNSGKKPAAKDSSDGGGKSDGDKSGGGGEKSGGEKSGGGDGASKSAEKSATASSKPSGGGSTEAA
jgi:putative FmdB family regulatory protein